MALARIPSSEELYASGLVAGKSFACRYMCARRVYVVVPCDILSLSQYTVLEDVRTGVRVTVGHIIAMTARGLITPMFSAAPFKAWAPQAPTLMKPVVGFPCI